MIFVDLKHPKRSSPNFDSNIKPRKLNRGFTHDFGRIEVENFVKFA